MRHRQAAYWGRINANALFLAIEDESLDPTLFPGQRWETPLDTSCDGMKIVCVKSEYEGREQSVDREYEDRFEKDILVYGNPGLAIYPKLDWQKKENLCR